MNASPVKIWLSLLLAVLAGYGGFSLWRINKLKAERQAEAIPTGPAAPVEAFTLTDKSGQEFDSISLQGKVWVVSFFFSTCPGPCIKMNNSVAVLQKEFGPQGATFVSITVDPETDTPQRLTDYAAHYHADPEQWRFLTGDLQAIKRIASDQLHLPFAKAAHSERLVLIGPDGLVQGRFAGTDPTEIALLKKKLTALLRKTDQQEAADSPDAPASAAADQGRPAEPDPGVAGSAAEVHAGTGP